MTIHTSKNLTELLTAAGYSVAKLDGALNSAYHDGTAVISTESKLAGSQANEKSGTFRAREANGTVREGKLTDPLRFINFQRALDSHLAKFAPSGQLTMAIIPASSLAWLKAKFHKTSVKRKTGKATVQLASNGNGARAMQPGNGKLIGTPLTVGVK